MISKVIIIYLPSLCSILGLIFKDALLPPCSISAQACVFLLSEELESKDPDENVPPSQMPTLYQKPYYTFNSILCLQITNMTEARTNAWKEICTILLFPNLETGKVFLQLKLIR